MPCNAHGHPPSCDCGWGGKNHNTEHLSTVTDWSQSKSHTNPNAKCPVCQNKVFFYRSPDGGSVFFDSLGPPWPKHLCTNNTYKVSPPGKGKKKKKQKWWPYPCGKVSLLPNIEGVCLLGEDERRLFIKTKPGDIQAHTPIWLRPFPGVPGKYYVSTFRLVNGFIKESGYVGYSMKGLSSDSAKGQFPSTHKDEFGTDEPLDGDDATTCTTA